MKLTPLADRVILKMLEAEETTKGGIILTASAKEKPSIAEVISVGPGGMVDGHDVVMTVKDVYKRQAYASSLAQLSEKDGAFASMEDEALASLYPGLMPVSYTHLSPYKRAWRFPRPTWKTLRPSAAWSRARTAL